MGRPKITAFIAWEIYLDTPKQEVKFTGKEGVPNHDFDREGAWLAARWELRGKGPAVTALDPATGQISTDQPAAVRGPRGQGDLEAPVRRAAQADGQARAGEDDGAGDGLRPLAEQGGDDGPAGGLRQPAVDQPHARRNARRQEAQRHRHGRLHGLRLERAIPQGCSHQRRCAQDRRAMAACTVGSGRNSTPSSGASPP